MHKEKLRELIAENSLDEAVELLKTLSKGARFEDEVLMLASRLTDTNKKSVMNTLSPADLELRRNQIAQALLQITRQLPEDSVLPFSPAYPVDASKSAGTGTGTGGPFIVQTGTGDGNIYKTQTGTGDGGTPATQTGTGDGGSSTGAGGHSKLPFWFSLGAFAVLLGITLLVPGWWRENTLLARTLLALAAGGVAATLPGFLNFEINNVLKAGGALAAFVLVFLVNPPKEEEPLTLTVFVVGKNGQSVQSLHQQGYILLDAEGERKRELIDDKGQAHFKNLRPGSEIRNVQVEFSEPYRPVHPDSVYRLDAKGQIYLAVALQNLGRIYGTVLAGDEPLEGVLVTVNERSDTTDLTGSYSIDIPEGDQRSDPEVKFFKKGYKLLIKTARPQTGLPLNIVMEKTKTTR